jgi:hypothetical protein
MNANQMPSTPLLATAHSSASIDADKSSTPHDTIVTTHQVSHHHFKNVVIKPSHHHSAHGYSKTTGLAK